MRGSAQHSRTIPLGVQHVRNRTVQITSPSHQVIYSIIISQQGGLPAMPSTRNIPLDSKCSSFLLQQLLLQVEQAFLEARNITTTDVIFEPDKSSLLPASENLLDIMGSVLLNHPDLRLEVAGRTDNVGQKTITSDFVKYTNQRCVTICCKPSVSLPIALLYTGMEKCIPW